MSRSASAGRPRVGLFGGTFDPPHLAHLAIAERAHVALRLDRVWFIPAGQPPHKRGRRITPAHHRLAMTRLAIRGNPAFRVSEFELDSDRPSFTVETVRRFAERKPSSLFLILGGDSLDDFRRWRDPDGILEHAMLAVAERPGSGRASTRRWALGTGRVRWIGNPGLEISSSALRAEVRAGRSIRYLVSEPVRRYLERLGLYR